MHKLIIQFLVIAVVILSGCRVYSAGQEASTDSIVISDVSTATITSSGLRVLWNTNHATSSKVYYDTVPHDNLSQYAYFTDEVNELVNEHIVYISGLQPSTTYHFRVASILINEDDYFITAFSSDYTFTTEDKLSTGGGGGGGGGGSSDRAERSFVSSAQSQNGVFNQNASVSSPDGALTIYIESGTIFRDADYKGSTYFTTRALESSRFGTPRRGAVIGSVYDLGPDGSNFTKPIMLAFRYIDIALPQEADERDLALACWSYTKKSWMIIEDSFVDTDSKTVYGRTNHFTPYAVVYQPQARKFYIDDLIVTPAEVQSGQLVTIRAIITNSGYESGEYQVILSIDDIPVESRTITVNSASSLPIDFSYHLDSPGIHTAAVNGIKTEFSTTAPDKPAPVLLQDLKIEPSEIIMGETASIEALAVNPNQTDLDCLINLKINDMIVEIRSLRLSSLSSEIVTFATSLCLPGNYAVDLEGLEGCITVAGYPEISDRQPDIESAEDPPHNSFCPALTYVIAAALLITLAITITLKRRTK